MSLVADGVAQERVLRRGGAGDPDERAAHLFEAETVALADQPMIPLYFNSSRRLVQPEIQGWVDNARGIYPSRWLSRR